MLCVGICRLLCRFQFRYLQLTCYIGLKWSLSYEISQHPRPYLLFLCLQVNQDISNGIKHLLLWNWILSLCLMTLQISLTDFFDYHCNQILSPQTWTWKIKIFIESYLFLSVGWKCCFLLLHWLPALLFKVEFYLIFWLQLFLWHSRLQAWTNQCNASISLFL